MPKLYKEIILGFAVILFGVFCWYFLRYVFYIGNLTTGCWIAGGILFILWGIVLCLAMLLIRDKRILFGSFLITILLFGLFFNNEPFYYLVCLIILFVAFVSANDRIIREENVQVNLNFWRIWKRGLPIFMTALILLISVVYYFSPHIEKFQHKQITVPRKFFNTIIAPLEGVIISRLEGQIKDLDVEASKILTPQQIADLKQKYGIEIQKNETIKDFLYALINYQLNNVSDPYKQFIPIGLAIAMFLGLKFISLFYVAFVILFSWLVLRILILLKFARIETETREVETIKL